MVYQLPLPLEKSLSNIPQVATRYTYWSLNIPDMLKEFLRSEFSLIRPQRSWIKMLVIPGAVLQAILCLRQVRGKASNKHTWTSRELLLDGPVYKSFWYISHWMLVCRTKRIKLDHFRECEIFVFIFVLSGIFHRVVYVPLRYSISKITGLKKGF